MASVEAYDALIRDQLVNRMFGLRLYELTDKPVRPFLAAQAQRSPIVRGYEAFVASAAIAGQDPVETTRLLATEIERARRFGFTDEELDAAKRDVLNNYAQAAAEGNKSESSSLAEELGRHFLTDEPVPGIAWEYNRVKTIVPPLTLEAINAHARMVLSEPGIPAVRDGGRPVDDRDRGGAAYRADERREGRHRAVSRDQSRDEHPGEGAATRTSGLREAGRFARHDHVELCQRRARHSEADRLQERRGAAIGCTVRRPVSLRSGRPPECHASHRQRRRHGLRHVDANGASSVSEHEECERQPVLRAIHRRSRWCVHARRHHDDAAAAVSEDDVAAARSAPAGLELRCAQGLPGGSEQQPGSPVRRLHDVSAVAESSACAASPEAERSRSDQCRAYRSRSTRSALGTRPG